MLPTPGSPPRPVLVNCTNIYRGAVPARSKPSLCSSQGDRKTKRLSSAPDGRVKKRVKLALEDDESQESSSFYESDSDVEMEDTALVEARQRKSNVLYTVSAMAMWKPGGLRPSLTTRPILQSFVSSHKSDSYKCPSVDANSYLSPPYACSYTYSAKRGGMPILAVATEQGSVQILNTSKRKDWDFEPPRTIFRSHFNGIFDIKWNPSDELLATCSGDQATRISCPKTATVLSDLRGHTSTVKSVAWDPTHVDLLSTGGRDGSICLWDLRVGKSEAPGGSEGKVRRISPVMVIAGAHNNGKLARKGRKASSLVRSVTSLVYPDGEPYRLISSGSFDGLLHSWDLRSPSPSKKMSKVPKSKQPTLISPFDPTVLHNSRRPRGLTSLTLGAGRTAGLIFALGTDSRVHTYSIPELVPRKNEYAHDGMQTNSFYVRVAASPCGNWLASGSNGTGSVFLFDVSNASRPSWVAPLSGSAGVQLKGQLGEVGAVDWAEGSLATCADDGTVRIWRPDIDIYRHCIEAPEEKKWEWSWSME